MQQRISHMKVQKKAEDDMTSAEKEAAVYQRLNELMDGTCAKMEASQRTKLLIKNMLEDKKSGWKKVVGQNKVKTKDQVEKEELKKLQDNSNRFGDDERRGGDR